MIILNLGWFLSIFFVFFSVEINNIRFCNAQPTSTSASSTDSRQNDGNHPHNCDFEYYAERNRILSDVTKLVTLYFEIKPPQELLYSNQEFRGFFNLKKELKSEITSPFRWKEMLKHVRQFSNFGSISTDVNTLSQLKRNFQNMGFTLRIGYLTAIRSAKWQENQGTVNSWRKWRKFYYCEKQKMILKKKMKIITKSKTPSMNQDSAKNWLEVEMNKALISYFKSSGDKYKAMVDRISIYEDDESIQDEIKQKVRMQIYYIGEPIEYQPWDEGSDLEEEIRLEKNLEDAIKQDIVMRKKVFDIGKNNIKGWNELANEELKDFQRRMIYKSEDISALLT